MGLGSGSWFDEPQPQVFQDGLDDLPVFDEADDPHDSPTSPLTQGQAWGKSRDQPSPMNSGTGCDLLNQPGPVFPANIHYIEDTDLTPYRPFYNQMLCRQPLANRSNNQEIHGPYQN